MGLKMDAQSAIGIELKKTKGNPGSGTYNADYSKVQKSSGAFSLKGRYSITDKKVVPGPGTYASKNNGKAAPSFGFGSASQRQKQAPATAPGPGNYHIPCSIGHMPGHTNARPKAYAYI